VPPPEEAEGNNVQKYRRESELILNVIRRKVNIILGLITTYCVNSRKCQQNIADMRHLLLGGATLWLRGLHNKVYIINWHNEQK